MTYFLFSLPFIYVLFTFSLAKLNKRKSNDCENVVISLIIIVCLQYVVLFQSVPHTRVVSNGRFIINVVNVYRNRLTGHL